MNSLKRLHLGMILAMLMAVLLFSVTVFADQEQEEAAGSTVTVGEEAPAAEEEKDAAVPTENGGGTEMPDVPAEPADPADPEDPAEPEDPTEPDVPLTGWQIIDGEKYYYSEDGTPVTGLKTIEGAKYYFDSNGKMKTGKITVGSYSYYFNKESGKAYVSGVFKLDGDLYGFDSNGRMLKGWQTIGGSRYYFNKTSYKGYFNCVKKIGSYYFGFNADGKRVKGWLTIGSDRYYINSKYHAYVNTIKTIGGVKYAFGKDGKVKTGWVTISGKKRYFNPTTGKMATGLTRIDGKLYLFSSSGVKITKTGTYNKKYVIFKSNGELLTGSGWTRYNGYKYYIESDGYSIRTNTESLVRGSSYILKVNKTKCTVNVLAYDSATGSYCIPVKSFVCSPGKSTPIRRCYLQESYRWHELIGPVWGQWCTRFYSGMLFHSVYYNSPNNNNTLSVSAWNKLGTVCSHGCIRVESSSAKWIYENKGRIKYVDIYQSSNPGPFGKKTAVKLKSWHTWDPTDPNMQYKCKAKGCH